MVNIPGGNPGGRSKYFLNNESTVKKLKQAAKYDNINITPCQGSVQIQFNAGTYVEVALRLLKYWEGCQGELNLNLNVSVTEVETFKDAGGINERHIVRLCVEGEQVTVTFWDTKCKIGVQAASQLVPYTDRVLFPFLHDQIMLHKKVIFETNEKFRTLGEVKVMTRNKRQQELVKSAAILESPVRSAAPVSMTSEDSPAPVRLLNKLITWVSTPSTPSRPGPEEQEEDPEKEQEKEQEVEQEEDSQYLPQADVQPINLPQPSTAGVLALTYFPPKEQESSTVAANKAAQQVAALQEGALQETALQAEALQEAAMQEAARQEGARQVVARQEAALQAGARQEAANQEVACFPCQKCENVCTDMDSLRSHMTEHTNTVCRVTREASSLTASGRLLILTPNFGNKHQKFVDTINNDHVDGIDTRSYHTLVVDVYARCYIYRSRTEIFISCVCPTCSIALAERFYRTRSKIFISWVGGRPVVYHKWSAANTSDIQQVDPLPS